MCLSNWVGDCNISLLHEASRFESMSVILEMNGGWNNMPIAEEEHMKR